MRTIIRVLIVGAACAVYMPGTGWPTPPTILLEEDFSGSQFPPEGWTTWGGDATWSWTNGGGFALGTATAAYNEIIFTHITSPDFTYTAGTIINIKFRYCAWKAASAQIDVEFHHPGGAISYGIPASSSWKDYSQTTGINQSGSCYVEWTLTILGYYGAGTATLYLDDVLITIDNAGVAAASLGRVKALYR